MTESEEAFPLEPKLETKKKEIAEKGHRTYKDLSKKELQLFERIYPFTPQEELERKFGLREGESLSIRGAFSKRGNALAKDEAYTRTVTEVLPGVTRQKGEKSPAYMLARFMNTVSEEERRELMNMYEEGCHPVDLMKQLIVIQSSRILRGMQLEQGSHQLHKTMNEATADMSTMIVRLEEMENGQKIKLGFDDSFTGLILASQQRKNNFDNNWEDEEEDYEEEDRKDEDYEEGNDGDYSSS